MNPIVIMGMVAIAITSFAMMISFSSDQVEYSKSVEKLSNIQVQRMQEDLTVHRNGNNILVENTGIIPVKIKEIRVLDDNGIIIAKQKLSNSVGVSQTLPIVINSEIQSAIDNS